MLKIYYVDSLFYVARRCSELEPARRSGLASLSNSVLDCPVFLLQVARQLGKGTLISPVDHNPPGVNFRINIVSEALGLTRCFPEVVQIKQISSVGRTSRSECHQHPKQPLLFLRSLIIPSSHHASCITHHASSSVQLCLGSWLETPPLGV